MKHLATLLEHGTFIWMGVCAVMVIVDRTIWWKPQAVLCGIAFAVYLAVNVPKRFHSANVLAIFVAGVAMGSLWYEMALNSIWESTGPILMFTLPVLVVWQLRTELIYSRRFTWAALAWLVPLVMGVAVFIPLEPVRETYAGNQDPAAPRHSLRSVLAMLTMVSTTAVIALRRRLQTLGSRVATRQSP